MPKYTYHFNTSVSNVADSYVLFFFKLKFTKGVTLNFLSKNQIMILIVLGEWGSLFH